ncbi:hypothetical protein HPP92_001397 [Vanilla planifolia]|uniref:RRM domain-containing protein n=1 Tax=Vanilla planifolia TaxID=51239 RepID=A0A835VLC3_VANPL|nr:hypothetical protein HPP92_001397 [Vanilla planifolia]
MPLRAARRSLAKKPSAMAKKTSSESSSASPLPKIEDRKTPEFEALSTSTANAASEAEAVRHVEVVEGEASQFPALVEGRTMNTEEVPLGGGKEGILGNDGENAAKDLHASFVDEDAKPAVPVNPIVDATAEEKVSQELEYRKDTQLQSEVALEDEGDEIVEMESKAEIEEILDDPAEQEETKRETAVNLDDNESEDEEVSEVKERMEEDDGVKETLGNYSSEEEIENKATNADNEENDDGDNEENEDNDYGIKQRESEVFIGGLDKDTVEDDLIKVFGVFGGIQSARIVRHPATKKSKGFAFVRFTSREDAMKVLTELKDGAEVNGKHVRIQASRDNATLYLGNICKTWTKDQVIDTLKSLGIEQLLNINLPKDSKNEGRIKGFAFLEFSSHSEAMLAFRRLKKPDAIFGRDRTARVAFTDDPLHPNEEVMLQVKTVYFEGIPLSWDEEKVKEIFNEYGKIEKVLLSRNFNSKKRKDFGFAEFAIRQSALACVEGINNSKIGDGDTKVRANLARPLNKSRLAKQGARGGYKVEKDGETIHEAGHSKKKKKKKLKVVQHKEEKQLNAESVNDTKSFSSQNREVMKNAKQKRPLTLRGKDSKGKQDVQAAKTGKRKNHSRKILDTGTSGRPTKKMRQTNHGKVHGRYFSGFGDRKGFNSAIREASYGAPAEGYPTEYVVASSSYRAYPYTAASQPQLRITDLEAHTGYLPALKQVTNSYGYDLRRSGTYGSELRSTSGYNRAVPEIHPSYDSYTDHANYQHSGYGYRTGGAYAARWPYH